MRKTLHPVHPGEVLSEEFLITAEALGERLEFEVRTYAVNK